MKKHPETWKGRNLKGRVKVRNINGKETEIFVKKARARDEYGKKRDINERNFLLQQMLDNREQMRDAGVPVSDLFEKEKSKRGLMHANLEEAHSLSSQRYHARIKEIIDIAKEALKKGILLDISKRTFGLGADGKLKVRGFDSLHNKEQVDRVIDITRAARNTSFPNKQSEGAKKIGEYLRELYKIKEGVDRWRSEKRFWEPRDEITLETDAFHVKKKRKEGDIRKGGRKFYRD